MVDRRLRAISRDDLTMLQAALTDSCRRSTARGEPVRCLWSTYLPDQDRLLSVFEAANIGAVRIVNENVLAPFTSIGEAVQIAPYKDE